MRQKTLNEAKKSLSQSEEDVDGSSDEKKSKEQGSKKNIEYCTIEADDDGNNIEGENDKEKGFTKEGQHKSSLER